METTQIWILKWVALRKVGVKGQGGFAVDGDWIVGFGVEHDKYHSWRMVFGKVDLCIDI